MNGRPLCVDLDGTLITTDLLWEAWFSLLRQRAWLALYALTKLFFSGRAAFKSAVAEYVTIDPAGLPYNEELLRQLKQADEGGRHIALVTASPRRWADAVATHLGLFDRVLATDQSNNLKGASKSQALVEVYGEKSFDYAGDHACDVEVWKRAHSAWVVGSRSIVRRAAKVAHVEQVFGPKRARLRDWLKALRLHQWVKNLLLFVPLLGSHQLDNRELLIATLVAFAAFGCVASANYLLNDLFDIQNDRHHPTKCRRPLAAGIVSVPSAVVVMVVLFVAGFVIASRLPLLFVEALGLYLLGALSYSLWLKRKAPLDTFTLAGLYTLRVLAGNAATGIPPSFWLLAFSIFLFLSLAMVKRHAELLHLTEKGVARGRGYLAADREMVSQLGVGAGYISVLVLALYLNSPEASALYQRPQVLWLVCFVVLHWITRLWLIAHRGWLHDDPVVFALRDRRSQITAVIVLALLHFAQ